MIRKTGSFKSTRNTHTHTVYWSVWDLLIPHSQTLFNQLHFAGVGSCLQVFPLMDPVTKCSSEFV